MTKFSGWTSGSVIPAVRLLLRAGFRIDEASE